MKIFRYRLKKIRLKRGLTQEELGKNIYTTKSSISQYENGNRIPSISTLILLSQILEVSVAYLLGLENEVKIENSTIFLSSTDLKILKAIKSNEYVYQLFIDNPEQVIKCLIH